MFRLGLTGSIATGKSTALAAFAELGLPVFSADDTVHALYAGRGRAAPLIEAAFPGTTNARGVDRAALAGVLGTPDRLKALEAIVHPLVRQELARFSERAAAAGHDIAVYDIPLLFETGFDYGLDAVAVTFCSDEEQRRRALDRPGMSVEKLDAILARQMPQAEKKARADYLIDTERPRAETARDIAAIVSAIRGSAAP